MESDQAIKIVFEGCSPSLLSNLIRCSGPTRTTIALSACLSPTPALTSLARGLKPPASRIKRTTGATLFHAIRLRPIVCWNWTEAAKYIFFVLFRRDL